MARFRRLLARWYLLRHHGEELNRRVMVEDYLAGCASGKRPLPDADTCRWLALRLGTPRQHWTEFMRGKR